MARISKTIRYLRQYRFSRSPYAAYVLGWHGHNNLGDEAVYGALKGYFGRYSFVDFPRRMPELCMHSLSKMEFGLLAGGTMIGGEMSGASHTQTCFSGCPRSLVFGSGVHHPDFWAASRGVEEWNSTMAVWKETLNRCDYVGVRGPDSAVVLSDWGVKNVEVIGDPALYYAADVPPACLPQAPPSVGLNAATTENLHMYGDGQAYQRELAELAGRFKQAGWGVYWYVVWPKDLSPTRNIAAISGTADAIVPIYRDCRAFMTAVRRHSLFVGTRLHAVALAAAAYVPSISLEYQPKCSDFMKSIGQQDSVIRIDRFSADAAWELARHMHRRRTEVVELLYRTVQMLRDKQMDKAQQYRYR